MRPQELLLEGIARSQQVAHSLVDASDTDTLNRRPDEHANSITWLVWHLARQQDAQIAALAGADQVWLADGWAEKFGLDLPADSTGYGHTADDVAKVRVDDPALLTGYLDAAVAATGRYLASLGDGDWDEVIDASWDPPVTRAVRLVSIVDDAAQHAGQAAYVRGLVG